MTTTPNLFTDRITVELFLTLVEVWKYYIKHPLTRETFCLVLIIRVTKRN